MKCTFLGNLPVSYKLREQLNIKRSIGACGHKYFVFNFKTCSKKPMVWTEAHNEMLLREMYLHEPRQFRKGSPQRGNVWEQISVSMNDLEHPKFDVMQKSVRDHYNLLEKQQKKRLREEEKASGISLDHSEFEDSMEDIIELFKMKDEEDQLNDAEKKDKLVADSMAALEMKQTALETLSESKKRKAKDQEGKRKRKMSNGSDTIAYLQQKVDSELRREEMKLKQEEVNERKAQQNSFIAQQEALTSVLKDTISAQQKQQEQLIQQMQVQNAAIMALMRHMANKD